MRRLPLRSPPRVRGKVFFFTGASFCAIFFLEPSGNLLLEPSGSSWVPPDGSIFVFAIGSPPRVRGKGVQSCNERVAVGITPAYAGKSWGRARTSSRRRDHPRVCGEKGCCKFSSRNHSGSPPRVRGKDEQVPQFGIGHGITPACAGKRINGRVNQQDERDHPRVCGEKGCCKFSSRNHSGSPPRVRGKDEQVPQFGIGHGITPACAGKRINGRVNQQDERDHPRVCGEKGSSTFWSRNHSGSPPRMRGKVDDVPGGVLHRGITPACAGKSSGLADSCDLLGDHPRVCGEKPTSYCLPRHIMGSPPRMRGKVSAQSDLENRGGITPAYAGKRAWRTCRTARTWDHPRVCGEKVSSTSPIKCLKGSPPRMRGKGSRMTRATSMVGITPACAGKSARRQAGPPGPAPPPQMRSGWSPPPCTGRQCRTRKSTHARRARIPVPAHTPAPQ